jgi:hypothetical protein
MSYARLTIRFLFILSLALALLNIYFTSYEFSRNYSGRQGIVLENKKVIGGDYLAFFTGGTLFKKDLHSLYSHKTHYRFQQDIINNPEHTSGFLPFVYPPLVAFFFSLFTTESFIESYAIWSFLSFMLYVSGVFILLRQFSLPTPVFCSSLIISLGLPAFFLRTITGGQTGAIGVLLCSTLFLCLSKRKKVLAGIITSLFYYKPPLFILTTIYSLLKEGKLFQKSFLVSGILLVGASFFLLPYSSIEEYFLVSINHSYGGAQYQNKTSVPHKGAGLYAIITTFGIASNRYQLEVLLLICISALILLTKSFKHVTPEKKDSFTLSFCIILTCSLFCSIHILDYDLCILIVPIILTLGTLHKNRMTLELTVGLLLLALFQLDLTIPYLEFEKHSLSIYSFVHGMLLIYLIWVHGRYLKGT